MKIPFKSIISNANLARKEAKKPENGWVLCAFELAKGKLKRDYVHGRLALPIWSWRSPATEGSTSGG